MANSTGSVDGPILAAASHVTVARLIFVNTRTVSAYKAALRKDPCAYCGEAVDVLDHIVPLVQRGDNSWENFAPACSTCNHAKAGRTLLGFLGYRAFRQDTDIVHDFIREQRSLWGQVGPGRLQPAGWES